MPAPHARRSRRAVHHLPGAAVILALVVLLQLQAMPVCTDAEAAAYIARGWDAYECDGDKAAQLAGEWDGDTCAETDQGCE